jgi:hypothetical protein
MAKSVISYNWINVCDVSGGIESGDLFIKIGGGNV